MLKCKSFIISILDDLTKQYEWRRLTSSIANNDRGHCQWFIRLTRNLPVYTPTASYYHILEKIDLLLSSAECCSRRIDGARDKHP